VALPAATTPVAAVKWAVTVWRSRPWQAGWLAVEGLFWKVCNRAGIFSFSENYECGPCCSTSVFGASALNVRKQSRGKFWVAVAVVPRSVP